jgi:hypothetical protein
MTCELSKSDKKILKRRLFLVTNFDWQRFQSSKPELAPDGSIFVGFERFASHFDENCLTSQNQKQTIVAHTRKILANLIVCTLSTFIGRGEGGTTMALNQQP